MTLKYVGAPVSEGADFVYRDYVTQIKSQDLSQAQIDSAINAGLSPYVNTTYVDAQDMLLATTSYIDTQDNQRVKLAHKNVVNGVPGLDSTGKVSTSLIYTSTQDQKWNQGLWSPSAYNAANVDATTTEVTLYTCPITSPGYPYRLVVTGLAEARASLSTEHPVIRVRVGSPTGEIIAMGRGQNEAMETYQFGDEFTTSIASGVGSDWAETYSGPSTDGYVFVSGGEAQWHDQGRGYRYFLARRTNPVDRYTGTDSQGVVAQIGSATGENDISYDLGPQGSPELRIYSRMNDAQTQFVFAQIDYYKARLMYANNGAVTQIGGTFDCSQSTNTPFIFYAGLPTAPRTFWLFKNTTTVFQVEDTMGVTAMGSNNRGWGWGYSAVQRNLGQGSPPKLNFVKAFEPITNFGTVTISPRRLDTMTALNGATTLYVTLARSGTAATATASADYPKLNVVAYPV